MTSKTDVILGCAYGTADVVTFLASLRNLRPTTEVVLFATRMPPATMEACERAGVRLMPFVSAATTPKAQRSAPWKLVQEGGLNLRRWLGRRTPPSSDSIAAAKIALHPNHSRFLYYRDFLLEQGRHYGRVFMSDVRDVIFQRDPFEFPADSPVLGFCEEPVNRIGTEKYNRRFILDAFGRAAVRELSDQVVICAGTIGGSRAAILGYLNAFIELTFRHPFRPGADQALHNVILRRSLVPCRIHDNRTSFVLTMDRMPEDDLAMDREHRLLTPAGAPFAVLHMFDRIPRALAIVQRQLALSATTPTP